MRILLTNDDGIEAKGLAILEQLARTISQDIWVVSPLRDQSGVSHAISFNGPLRVQERAKQRFAVEGTPSDCIIMAIGRLMPAKPDLILSGINHGRNVAEDTLYSGTIAGAREGMLHGVKAIALSQASNGAPGPDIDFSPALEYGPELLRKLTRADLSEKVMFNVNFPSASADAIKGIRVTSQGWRDAGPYNIDMTTNCRNQQYYWICGRADSVPTDEKTDIHAIKNRYISVTPLNIDLTDSGSCQPLATHFNGLMRDESA